MMFTRMLQFLEEKSHNDLQRIVNNTTYIDKGIEFCFFKSFLCLERLKYAYMHQ